MVLHEFWGVLINKNLFPLQYTIVLILYCIYLSILLLMKKSDCLHFALITNNAAMDILVYVSLCTCVRVCQFL